MYGSLHGIEAGRALISDTYKVLMSGFQLSKEA